MQWLGGVHTLSFESNNEHSVFDWKIIDLEGMYGVDGWLGQIR